MKMKISKIGAAKSQLLEAINLFFEERDPVSIHTLVGAALEILNDHFDDIGEVWDHNFVLHRSSIYIKDAYRKQWSDILNKAKNFFKHADRDLKRDINEIDFDPDINELFTLEAVARLQLIEKDIHIFEPEFRVFIAWLMIKRPNLLKEDQKYIAEQLQLIKLDSRQDYRHAITVLKNKSLITEGRKRKA
jgi:hypothetical protein